jgi:hypothetical protein
MFGIPDFIRVRLTPLSDEETKLRSLFKEGYRLFSPLGTQDDVDWERYGLVHSRSIRILYQRYDGPFKGYFEKCLRKLQRKANLVLSD